MNELIVRLRQWTEIQKVVPVLESADVAGGRDAELGAQAACGFVVFVQGWRGLRGAEHPVEAAGQTTGNRPDRLHSQDDSPDRGQELVRRADRAQPKMESNPSGRGCRRSWRPYRDQPRQTGGRRRISPRPGHRHRRETDPRPHRQRDHLHESPAGTRSGDRGPS